MLELLTSVGTLPLIALMVLGGGAAMAWPMVQERTNRSDMKRRLRIEPASHSDTGDEEVGPTARPDSRKEIQAKALKTAQDFYAKTDPENVARLRTKLIRAGYFDPRAVAWFFLARFAFFGGGLVLGLVLWMTGFFAEGTSTIAFAMGASIVGYFMPGFILSRKIASKMLEYRNGFPDFMDLMVVCSDAGMSMEAGIDRVSREIQHTYPSLSENLQLVSIELRAGRSLNDALKSLAERLGMEEVRAFATLLQQSKELGTSLSGALRVFSEEMRHKRMAVAEEKAHALPAKMSVPVTACILPVVMLVAVIPVIVTIANMKQ